MNRSPWHPLLLAACADNLPPRQRPYGAQATASAASGRWLLVAAAAAVAAVASGGPVTALQLLAIGVGVGGLAVARPPIAACAS